MPVTTDQLKAVFLAALEKTTAGERTAYLDEACAADAALRHGVEALLRAHEHADPLLDRPAAEHLDRNSSELAGADDALVFLEPPSRPDSLGRIGHYEVHEVLGRGGFGIVFRAFDDTLQRVVAIKVLAPQLAATSPARQRFLREARSSARVRHENVVQVYAVEERPLPYLVMEFIPGETLQQRLDRTGPLEAAEVVQLGRQIAAALAAAHAQGLIHRDVKPGNILLEAGPHPHVKITDFGLARAADDASVTQSGFLAGTPLFMSPEQAQGDTLDHRADLFSLGSVLYTMCSGRPPFRANGTLAVLKRVAEDTPRPIQEIIPEVPQWLCDLIARLHAKKPADRIGTAREVADLLAHGLEAMQRPGTIPALPKVAPAAFEKKRCEGEATVEMQEIPKPAPALRSRGGKRRWGVAAAVLLLLLAGLGFTEATGVTNVRGTVIRLFSPEGTLVVDVGDPGVSVKIEGPDLVITGAGAREIRLPVGKYTVEARKDGKVVHRELVSVTKNGKPVVRVTQEAPPDANAARAAWERSVAAMSAQEQVKAVSARLKDLNPGFDGQVAPMIENDVVTGLAFSTDQVSDISPVRALTQLRSLDCSGSEFGRGRLSDLAPLRGLPLTSLGCRYSLVSDLSPLKGMKLTSLDCRHTQVSDADVKMLAGLKTLQWLSLWGTKVKDAGLKELAGLRSLQWLSLETTEVTDAGLKELAGLQSLEHLSLYNVEQVTDAGLKELAGLKALKYLDLRGPKVTDAAARKLASVLPSLRIEMGGGAIEARASLDPDRRAAEYVLSIGGRIRINEENADRNAPPLPPEAFRLTCGLLGENKQVSDEGLACFKDCKSLTTLDLEHTQVSDAGLAHFKDCKHLTTLNLNRTKVTDVGLVHFKDCKHLTYLELGGAARASDAGLAHFAGCKDLTTLVLWGTRLGDPGLAHFRDCKNLTKLWLDSTQVSDAGLKHLTRMTKLAELFLNRMPKVTAAGIDELAKALPQCTISCGRGVIKRR